MSTPLRYLVAAAAYLAPALLLASDVLLVMFVSTPGLLLQRDHRAQWQVGAGAALAALGALAIVIRPAFLVAPTRPPAVLFPLGLLVLSGAMIGSTVPRRVAALIGAGALLFPLAHMSGVPAALIGGDVIFLAAFWSLGTRMLNPKPQIPNPKSQGT